MEGIAYLIRKNLDYLQKLNIRTNKLISLGGGSKSNVWNQIKADAIGKKLILIEREEAALLGAAVLAAVNLGLYKDYKSAIDEVVKVKKVYNSKKYNIYNDKYMIFLRLYNKLKDTFPIKI